jgi:hypothetical protein
MTEPLLCEECHKPILNGQTYRTIPAGNFHPDCYYVAVGRVFEQNPIGHR